MSPVRRITLQCLVLQTVVRLVLALTLAVVVSRPFASSNLLQSARLDTQLLAHGATAFSDLLIGRWPRLVALGPWLLLLLGVAWALKLALSSLVLAALGAERSPWSRQNFAVARTLWLPFAVLSLGAIVAVCMALVVFALLLPSIGALLVPLLGDRGTDLTELGLLGTVGAFGLFLTLLVELARADQAFYGSDLHTALVHAIGYLRDGAGQFIAQSLPRLSGVIVLLGANVWVVLSLHRSESGSHYSLCGSVLSELVATVSGFIYLGWLSAAKRLMDERQPARFAKNAFDGSDNSESP